MERGEANRREREGGEGRKRREGRRTKVCSQDSRAKDRKERRPVPGQAASLPRDEGVCFWDPGNKAKEKQLPSIK